MSWPDIILFFFVCVCVCAAYVWNNSLFSKQPNEMSSKSQTSKENCHINPTKHKPLQKENLHYFPSWWHVAETPVQVETRWRSRWGTKPGGHCWYLREWRILMRNVEAFCKTTIATCTWPPTHVRQGLQPRISLTVDEPLWLHSHACNTHTYLSLLHTHTHSLTHTHTYIYIHTHTHTHTQPSQQVKATNSLPTRVMLTWMTTEMNKTMMKT